MDVNILLYASDESSSYHQRARDLVDRLAAGPDLVYLFWPTVMAYVRLATHAAVSARPLSLAAAAGNMESLLARPHIHSPGEQDRFWDRFREAATDGAATGNLVSDAHLVALMRQNGVRAIWTHDRDFRRFSNIDVQDPFADT